MIISKPEEVGVSSKRLQRINDLTARQIDEEKLAGTITLLARRGQNYYIFLNMLLNKGRYGDKYMLSPKTVQLMTMNHLPGDTFSLRVPGTLPMMPPGLGMGYTFGVMVDPVKTGALGTKGSFSWGGAASTLYTVDPKEELIAIYMTQVFPDVTAREYGVFMNADYQSLID